MGVRLVIGRAGTGKTALCVREMRAAMERSPLGGALLWIVPEQGTFTAERLLLTADGGGYGKAPRGTFRAQVLGFRRLAMMILCDAGRGDRNVAAGAGAAGAALEEADLFAGADKPMHALARQVLLEETVRRERPRLTVFAGVADRPGFIASLDSALRELRQHGHTGQSLRSIAETANPGPAAARRLLDLAILLDAWENQMAGASAWDSEAWLAAAAERVHACPLIAGGGEMDKARIWVDAISAISGLEMRLLAALARHAGELTLTLLADPDAPGIRNPASQTNPDFADGLFARTERLYQRLLENFDRAGVPIEKIQMLRPGHRFANTDLAQVESDLFSAGPRVEKAVAPGPENPAGNLFSSQENAAGGVEIWQCSDPETEIRAVARQIRHLVLAGEKPLRFRDIGVISTDLKIDQDAIRRIFTEHRIPHFIDEKRTASHHPLVEFLHSAVAIARTGWGRDEVMLLLKTGLAGIDSGDVALVENYCIEHGITRTTWRDPWTWLAPNQDQTYAGPHRPGAPARQRLARVNTIREQLWNQLRDFTTACAGPRSDPPETDTRPSGSVFPPQGSRRDAADFVRALQALLLRMGVHERLAALTQAATAAGDLELAQVHAQIGRETQRLLKLLGDILAGRQRTLEEFELLLAGALEKLTVGLIPPTVDQVLVSSVMRSRVPEMEAVFLIGAAEGQFPRVMPEDPILPDSEREAFNEIAAEPIGPGSERELLEMPFFDYVALTRARRLLVVCYPMADRSGKVMAPSRHIARLKELLGPRLREKKLDAQTPLDLDRITTPDDLLSAIARWQRNQKLAPSRVGAANEQSAKIAEMQWLSRWIGQQSDPPIAQGRRQIARALAAALPESLDPALAERFFPRASPLQLSVSRLEHFAACPLHYFSQYTLGLTPRKEFQIDQLDMGQLLHRALEGIYRAIIAGEIPWPDLPPEDLPKIVAEALDAAVRELHSELEMRTPGYRQIRRRVQRVLEVHTEADRRRALAGHMRPVAVEMEFSGDAPAQTDASGRLIRLPVLSWRTRAGRRLELAGKIDRIDAAEHDPQCMAVVDYKSNDALRIKFAEVAGGLSLQLLAYTLVLRELARAWPAGAFYHGLAIKAQRAKSGQPAPRPPQDDFFQRFKPHGVADADWAPLLDAALGTAEGGIKSAWYPLSINKNGTPSGSSDLLAHEDFTAVLDFVREKLSSLSDQLASGKIAALPYHIGANASGKTPCDFCDFVSLCRFDRVSGKYRRIETLKKTEALQKMRDQIPAPDA